MLLNTAQPPGPTAATAGLPPSSTPAQPKGSTAEFLEANIALIVSK